MTNQTKTRRVAGAHPAVDTAATVLASHRAIIRDLEASLPLKHAGGTIRTRAELRSVVSALAADKKVLFTKNVG